MRTGFSHGHALLIGIGETEYRKWSLPVTVKDAQAIQRLLTGPDLCAYPNDEQHTRLLHDARATRQAILADLTWLAERSAADPEATVVVYYSGHGWLDQATGHYYLIQHDADPKDLPGSALSAEQFTQALRRIQAARLLIILDCCHAEGMATSKEGQPSLRLPTGFAEVAPPKGLVEELKQGAGRAVFTSSRGDQRSYIRSDATLSIYTYHLLEALQGAGSRPGDTAVHLSHLMSHLNTTVPQSARLMAQAEQVPFFDLASEDFAIALLRGGKGLPAGGWPAAQPEATETIRQVLHAIDAGSVAIDGSVRDSQIITGINQVAQQGKYNLTLDQATNSAFGAGAQVNTTTNQSGGVNLESGNQIGSIGSISGGDNVGGDKIATGNISGTGIAIGRGAQAHVTSGDGSPELALLFSRIYQYIETRRDDANVDKRELTSQVRLIEEEARKGQEANPSKVERWLRGLIDIAPDLLALTVESLISPAAGVSAVIRQVAQKFKEGMGTAR